MPQEITVDEFKAIYALKTIAVVGLSRDPSKDSYGIAQYLQRAGYKIIPVNPSAEEILGEKAYRSVLQLPEEMKKRLDIVDVFRRSSDVPQIAQEALQLREKYGRPLVFWTQLGIRHDESASKLRAAGITVVMDNCLGTTHRLLKGRGVIQ